MEFFKLKIAQEIVFFPHPAVTVEQIQIQIQITQEIVFFPHTQDWLVMEGPHNKNLEDPTESAPFGANKTFPVVNIYEDNNVGFKFPQC